MPTREILGKWQCFLRTRWHFAINTYWARLVLGAGSGTVVAWLLFKVHLLGGDRLTFDTFQLDRLAIVAFAYLGGRSALAGYRASANATAAASAAPRGSSPILQFSLARLLVGTALSAAILGIYGAERVPERIALFWTGLTLLSTVSPRLERVSGAACTLFASLALVHAMPQPYTWPLSAFGQPVAQLVFQILYLTCLAAPVILLRLFGGLRLGVACGGRPLGTSARVCRSRPHIRSGRNAAVAAHPSDCSLAGHNAGRRTPGEAAPRPSGLRHPCGKYGNDRLFHPTETDGDL